MLKYKVYAHRSGYTVSKTDILDPDYKKVAEIYAENAHEAFSEFVHKQVCKPRYVDAYA